MNIHTIIIKPCNTAVLVLLSMCMLTGASQAEIHIVTQSFTSFSPSTLEISEGDTVQWNWTGGTHTVTNGTSTPGGDLFNEPLTLGNPTVSILFDTVGTIPYFCTPHINSGMTGTITVVAAVDTTPPVITITGENPVDIPQFGVYTDEGATATDDVDGVITNDIETVSIVITFVVGEYSVTYNVSDTAGNAADEKTRIVNVVAPADTTPPVITIVGDNPATVFQNSVYTDEGATATDNVDGVITGNIVPTSNVDTATVGQYSVAYNVSDVAGNIADQKTRVVDVIANLDPSNIYVDGSHDGLEVGTDVNPFKTVASAIEVAENNAVINITVGSYTETLESDTLTSVMVTLQVDGDGTVTIGDPVIQALISGFHTRLIKPKIPEDEE